MKSGKDDLLVGDLLEESARTYSIAIGKNGFTMNVDRRLWRKVIRPKDIKEDGTLDPESHVVFWPYTPTTDDEFELIPESTLKKQCPTSFQYLLRFKNDLLSRRDSGKTWSEHGRPWYSLARIGKPSDYLPPSS